MNENDIWLLDEKRTGLIFQKTETWHGAFSVGTGTIQGSSKKTDCLGIIDSPISGAG